MIANQITAYNAIYCKSSVTDCFSSLANVTGYHAKTISCNVVKSSYRLTIPTTDLQLVDV